MKKIYLPVVLFVTISACTNNNATPKATLDDVIKIHDKVMAADEHLEKNKMLLDSLAKQGKAGNKDSAKLVSDKLAVADSTMENWMHKFDPDQKGKSEQQVADYMADQKKQITAIDSQLNSAITVSDQYLKSIKQ